MTQCDTPILLARVLNADPLRWKEEVLERHAERKRRPVPAALTLLARLDAHDLATLLRCGGRAGFLGWLCGLLRLARLRLGRRRLP